MRSVRGRHTAQRAVSARLVHRVRALRVGARQRIVVALSGNGADVPQVLGAFRTCATHGGAACGAVRSDGALRDIRDL